MPTLALMEQGMTLAVEGELFSIEREGTVVSRVRMAEVDEVLVFGSIAITPAAAAALLQRGIDSVFLTAHGRYRGRLVGKPGRNVELRLAQFERLRDPAVAVALARSLVAGKIANQRYILLRAQREQKREDLAEAIGKPRRRTSAPSASASGIPSSASRRGRAARRSTPVNAMLSFGYTLLGTVMESAILRVGLDSMLGVFHTPEYGRPSLMLDLIEELRPVVVDALALRVVNRREVAAEDFEELHDEAELAAVCDEESDWGGGSDRAVWLGPTGRRVFFRAWGRRLRETQFYPVRQQTLTLEEIMQQQVYQLARLLRREVDQYQAFVLR